MANGPLFSIGSLHVQYYGLCMALGIIACFAFLYFTMQKRNFNDEAIDKILIIGIGATAFGVFMAMVFQALYDYIEKPSEGFKLGESMTFFGGLIGGVVSFLIVWNLYIFVIAPRTKVKFLKNNMNASLTDALQIIPVGVTIAHAFGRLGCTFAGCCHGGETTAWYGIWMYIQRSDSGYPVGDAVKVVPTQLFECLFLVILTAVMIVLLFKFKFKYNLGVYAIAYGIWRFIIEFVRKDHRGNFIGSLTPSQFWSIILVLLGIAYFFIYKYWLVRFEKHPENQPPVRQKKVKAAAAVGGNAPDEDLAEKLTLDEATRDDSDKDE
ncbi:MAG: prolipoprotein diacylglyceryl transferase [Clostridiales bacterium]|nr:prolipoprotein diacylglyceryl transferase [Clostridiales bacterium]